MKNEAFIKKQWIIARIFAIVLLLMVPFNVFASFVDAQQQGVAPPWDDLQIGLSILLFGFALLEVSRRFFNFMLGNDTCSWRKWP